MTGLGKETFWVEPMLRFSSWLVAGRDEDLREGVIPKDSHMDFQETLNPLKLHILCICLSGKTTHKCCHLTTAAMGSKGRGSRAEPWRLRPMTEQKKRRQLRAKRSGPLVISSIDSC